jgi:hypothetical protein
MKGFEDSDLKQLKERITKLLKENHDLRSLSLLLKN